MPSRKSQESSLELQLRLNREALGSAIVGDMREGRRIRQQTFVDKRKEASRRACRNTKDYPLT